MKPQSLRTISLLRRKSQSDLARIAGVSKQAVSLWFRSSPDADLNVRAPHLRALSRGLQVKAEDLLDSLPVLDDREMTRKLETILLWDHLYSDLAAFAVGLVRGESAALARLVQVYGLYPASNIVPQNMIWDRFQEYKRHIRPVRREQVEKIWQIRQSLKSI